MRRLFSLLPLLLPLPNLVQAADPVCTLENRVCAENNNSGKCIHYENTFTCVTLNPGAVSSFRLRFSSHQPNPQ